MHGEVEPPRVVSARFGRLGKDLHLFQVTVRLHTKQAMAIYTKKGQAIAGHPNKTQDILEYIVFERTIGGDNTNDWRIYGRVYEKPIIDI
jgi:predicted lipid-binding transport protein (Tim44 family)